MVPRLLFGLAIVLSIAMCACGGGASATSNQAVTVVRVSPSNASSATSPVAFDFTASSQVPITSWSVSLDGKQVYQAAGSSEMRTSLTMAAGTHQVEVQAQNSNGIDGSSTFTLTVVSGSPSPTPTPAPNPTPTPSPAPTPAPTPTPTPSGLNFYVAPGGQDSNDGSAARPWATIQHAADSAHPGATIHVAPGSYTAVTSNVAGTAAARIRFLSDVKWSAQILITSTFAGWQNNASYVDIEGFDISGSGRAGIANAGSNVRIIGNHVHNITVGACDSNGGAAIVNENYSAADNDIIANLVHDIGPSPGSCNTIQGIYHSNLRGHIYNNIVYRVSAWGIHLWHAANNVTISGNLSFNNGGSGVGGGMIIGDGDSPGGVTNDYTVVTNNIVMQNGGVGIEELGNVGTHNVFANNLLYQNPTDFQLIGVSDVGTVHADPLLVNYRPDGGGDYHLASGSPAINAGTTQGAPPNDFDGGARPVGSGYDIGPYEFGSTPAPWPFE